MRPGISSNLAVYSCKIRDKVDKPELKECPVCNDMLPSSVVAVIIDITFFPEPTCDVPEELNCLTKI